MHSRTFSILLFGVALIPDVLAAPVNTTAVYQLEARAADCLDNKPAPCICNNQLSMRLKNLKCPAKAFEFKDPASLTDATVIPVNKAHVVRDGLECDHIVEAGFVAAEINNVSGICTHFLSGAQGKADYQAFLNVVNTGTATSGNLVNVAGVINLSKGIVITGNKFGKRTSQKSALGAANYMELLKNNGATFPGTGFATTIDQEMTRIMGTNPGFDPGFQQRYDTTIQNAITSARQQAPSLSLVKAPSKPKSSAAVAKKAAAKQAKAAKSAAAKSAAARVKAAAKVTAAKKVSVVKAKAATKKPTLHKVASGRVKKP